MSEPRFDWSWLDKTRYEGLLNQGEAAFLWRHGYGFQETKIAPALANGLGWHDAMDIFWRMVKWEGKDFEAAIAAGVAAWVERWGHTPEGGANEGHGGENSPLRAETPTYNRRHVEKSLRLYASVFETKFGKYELLDIETSFKIDIEWDSIYLPVSNFEVDVFPSKEHLQLRGRWDKPVRDRETGLIIIGEHKSSTSADKSKGGFPTPWLHKWEHDAGTQFYAVCGRRAFGTQYGGVLVDGTLTTASPDHALVGPIEFSDAGVERFEQDIKTRVERLRRGEYLCNPNACAQWGRTCGFGDLCNAGWQAGDDVPTPPGMEVRHWNPER